MCRLQPSLVLLQSDSGTSVWCRLAGCYESLSGGLTGDALVDFTGGVNEAIDIREGGYQTDEVKQVDLFEKLHHAHTHKSLISCSIAVSSPSTFAL